MNLVQAMCSIAVTKGASQSFSSDNWTKYSQCTRFQTGKQPKMSLQFCIFQNHPLTS